MLISHANIFAVSVSFILFILIFYLIEKKLSKKKSIVYVIICALYATFLLTVTVLGRLPNSTSNIYNLFLTYKEYYNGNMGAKYDILYNIFLFIPVGLLTIRYKQVKFIIGVLLVLPIFIEFTQLVTSRGVFEITDIINNEIGGFIGFLIALLFSILLQSIKQVLSNRRKDKKVERTE